MTASPSPSHYKAGEQQREVLNLNRDIYLIIPYSGLDVLGESQSLDLFRLIAQAWP